MRLFTVLVLPLALLGLHCAPPGTPVGSDVFHYYPTGAMPADVSARVRGAAPVNDGCALALHEGREEVRFANRALRDPATGRLWLQEVRVTVSKNVDARIDVGEVRIVRTRQPAQWSDGVRIRVTAHENGGGYSTAEMTVAGDATCGAD